MTSTRWDGTWSARVWSRSSILTIDSMEILPVSMQCSAGEHLSASKEAETTHAHTHKVRFRGKESTSERAAVAPRGVFVASSQSGSGPRPGGIGGALVRESRDEKKFK